MVIDENREISLMDEMTLACDFKVTLLLLFLSNCLRAKWEYLFSRRRLDFFRH